MVTFTVEHHVHGKWVCRICETIHQAPVPLQVIDKGLPSAGLHEASPSARMQRAEVTIPDTAGCGQSSCLIAASFVAALLGYQDGEKLFFLLAAGVKWAESRTNCLVLERNLLLLYNSGSRGLPFPHLSPSC